MTRKTALFLCIFLLNGYGYAYPEEKKLRLSIKDSLMATIKNNFNVHAKKTDPAIAEKEINIAESEFDVTLFGEAKRSMSKTPSTSAYANPDVSELTSDTVSLGFRQKLKPGTSYELSLNTVSTDTNSLTTSLDPEYFSSISLSLNQPLLKGSGNAINETNVLIAKNVRDISRHAFEMSVMEILTATREAYWNLVYLNRELEVQLESLDRARDFLARIKLQVEVGVLAPIEIVAAKAFVAVREEALIGIREQIGNTQDNLKSLLNIEEAKPGSAVLIEPTETPSHKIRKPDVEKLLDIAFENRPDIKQARLDLDNKGKQREYYMNNTLPQVDLQGSVTYKGVRGTGRTFTDISTGLPKTSSFTGSRADSFADIGKGKYYDYSIGIMAEYPLSNRLAKNQLAKSSLQESQAQTTLQSLKQAVELDVLKAARELETAEQRIRASKASRILAEKKLEAEIKKYEVGSSTSFAVLEYQKDLAAEKSNEIKSIIDHRKAVAHMELATGTALANNNIALEFMAQ